MNKNPSEIHLKLSSQLLESLFQGKSITFLESYFRVTITPPNEGVTVPYHEWAQIKSYLINNTSGSVHNHLNDLFKHLEERKTIDGK